MKRRPTLFDILAAVIIIPVFVCMVTTTGLAFFTALTVETYRTTSVPEVGSPRFQRHFAPASSAMREAANSALIPAEAELVMSEAPAAPAKPVEPAAPVEMTPPVPAELPSQIVLPDPMIPVEPSWDEAEVTTEAALAVPAETRPSEAVAVEAQVPVQTAGSNQATTAPVAAPAPNEPLIPEQAPVVEPVAPLPSEVPAPIATVPQPEPTPVPVPSTPPGAPDASFFDSLLEQVRP
jgi:hypothetical protein